MQAARGLLGVQGVQGVGGAWDDREGKGLLPYWFFVMCYDHGFFFSSPGRQTRRKVFVMWMAFSRSFV